MNIFKGIVFIFYLCFYLVSCKGIQRAAVAEQKTENSSNGDSLFAGIERSPCFGRCPTYLISIYKSGYVVYEGKQWVDNIGFFYTFITSKQVAEISALAESIGFGDLKDAYHDPGIMDAPTTFTFYRVKDKIKRIDNTFGDPPHGLIDFENHLDSLFINTRWIKLKNNIKD